MPRVSCEAAITFYYEEEVADEDLQFLVSESELKTQFEQLIKDQIPESAKILCSRVRANVAVRVLEGGEGEDD